MKELNLLQRRVEKAREFCQEVQKIENETHAFLWREVNSIAPLLEKRITLYSPMDSRYSPGDLLVRDLLGFQVQEGSTTLLVSIQKSFDLTAFSVKLETREGNVADRKSIIFQISKHGTDQDPIWGTRMFIGGVNNDREISAELNQPNKSLDRLEIGLDLLNFISNLSR